jgi:hypothetical protein
MAAAGSDQGDSKRQGIHNWFDGLQLPLRRYLRISPKGSRKEFSKSGTHLRVVNPDWDAIGLNVCKPRKQTEKQTIPPNSSNHPSDLLDVNRCRSEPLSTPPLLKYLSSTTLL